MTVSDAKERVRAIDIARALVIIGVVFNHAVDGLIGTGVLRASSPISSVNDVLYVFRMPALVFLVGVFIPGAVAKRGPWKYLVGRAVLMLYLYVVWFAIEGIAETAAGGLRNGSRPLYQLLFLWRPIAHLWFLPFLVVATGLVLLVRPWARDLRSLLGGSALLGVTLFAWGWNPPVIGLRGISLIAFVAIGSLVGLGRLKRMLRLPVLLWAGIGALAGLALSQLARLDPVPATQMMDTNWTAHLVSFGTAGVGTVLVLALSVLLAAIPVPLGWLESIGRQTLPIYLAHVIVVAAVRILCIEVIGVRDVPLLLGVCLLAGVGVPLLLVMVARRLRLHGLFSLPDFLANALPLAVSSASRGERK